MITFAALQFEVGHWAWFRFGTRERSELSPRELIRRIIDDYASRRDEVWDLEPLQALEGLDQTPDPDSPESLVALIELYGLIGQPQGSERVATYLGDANDEVKLAAIRSLGQMGLYGSIPLIEPFLGHADIRFRAAAIAALGKFGSEELIGRVEAASAGDPRLEAVRLQAVEECRALAREDLAALADILLEIPDYEDLMNWISYVRPRLAAILVDHSRTVLARTRAARLLALSRSRLQAYAMTAIAQDESEPVTVREQCLIGIGRCHHEEGLPVLAEMLGAAEIPLRRAAIQGLGEFADGQAFDALLGAWEHFSGLEADVLRALEKVQLRPGAADVLERLQGDWGLDAEASVFIDESGQLHRGYSLNLLDMNLASVEHVVRREAALLLSLLGDRHEETALLRMSREDPDATNRQIASVALMRWRLRR